MSRAVLVLVGLLAMGATAYAHDKPATVPQFTSLDRCALQGRGVALPDSDVCLKVTGGIYYSQSWSNGSLGGVDAVDGMTIVDTPAGKYAVPAAN